MSVIKYNPGLGRYFHFFGKFRSKLVANRREREHPGSFILQRNGYYYVLKAKTRKRNPEWKPPFAKRKRKRLGVLYQKAFAKFSKENPLRARGTELRIGASGKLFVFDRKSGKVLFETYDPKKATAFEKQFKAKFGKRKRQNPTRGTLIYGRVLKIFARKTSGPYKGQDFVHTFKPGAILVGMPDGSLRITHP